MDKAFGELEEAARGWGMELSAEQRGQIRRFLDDLIEHNRKVNLTAEEDPEALLLRHIADGLAAVRPLREFLARPDPAILDLGSGGGFVGMAIKIAWPQAQVTLMESLKRKFEFLNLAAARSGLRGLRVVRQRAHAGAALGRGGGFDAVVERALAQLPEALRLGLPLTASGGCLLAYQSAPPSPEEPELAKALASLPARLLRTFPYRLPREERDRTLALFVRG